jgi:hypothetical protein
LLALLVFYFSSIGVSASRCDMCCLDAFL